MDYQLILLGTIAVVMILGILVLGGLVLSARSYIALVGLVASIGSSVERLAAAILHLQITSSTATGQDIISAPKDTTRITPE